MSVTFTRGNFNRLGAFADANGFTVTFYARSSKNVSVLIFNKRNDKLIIKADLDRSFSIGRVYSVTFPSLSPKNIKYLLNDEFGTYVDDFAPLIIGREKWADASRFDHRYAVFGGVGRIDQMDDHFPELRDDESIIYKVHMRGFTMNRSVKKSEQGNVKGFLSRLPYIRQMGFTAVEFMPLYEFEEIRYNSHLVIGANKKEEKVFEEPYGTNFWGYGEGNYFAPKSAYFGAKDPEGSFENLVKTLHENGMEMIMEISIENRKPRYFIPKMLRFWHERYHVDGFHLLGAGLPIDEIAENPYLSDVKVFYDRIDNDVLMNEDHKHLYLYNDDFIYPLRRLQNHMDGSVAETANMMKRQNEKYGFVNYAANTDGFTLYDAYSYGEKHNYDNGEDNCDGSNYNCSFNHGAEGDTANKGIISARLNAVRSALALTILSQAVPLVRSGDESLNTQYGNNNPYCQDNKTGWTDYSRKNTVVKLEEYVRRLIAFRKAHTSLSSPVPMKETDYRHAGLPDISYHGREPWIMGIGEEKKGLGIMYCGMYGRQPEEDVMLCINFYYGEETFALPRLPEGRSWYYVSNTASFDFVKEGIPVSSRECVIVPGESVTILIGK